MKYPIVIHKDAGSDYGVTVPDLPGCHSAGSTMSEAIMGATEAIECHIEALLCLLMAKRYRQRHQQIRTN